MIDLFVALFGSAFYGRVLNNKKRRKASMQTQSMLASVEAQSIGGKMNEERQKEITEYVLCGFHADEIYEKLHDDLKFIYGEGFTKEDFPIPGTDGYEATTYLRDYKNNAFWAIVLLLSHEGIIHDEITSPGLPVGYDEYIKRNIKICQRVEELLDKNGASITLCFRSDASKPKTVLSGGRLKPESIYYSEIIRLWKNYIDDKPRLGKIKIYYLK